MNVGRYLRGEDRHVGTARDTKPKVAEMNERIRELADKAGLRFTQLMSNPMVPVVDGKETDLEKFAELIVRECACIADDMKSLDVAKEIKQHFGVEE